MEDLKIFNLDRRYANLFDKEDMIAGRKMVNGKNTVVVNIFKLLMLLLAAY